MEIVAEIIPDEDLTGLKDDIPIREQVELDSMDFLDIIMELRKRYGIEVPEDDYMQLATIDSSVAYLEPRMRDL
jgi:acyl carrier protein